ncbi:hypothetical protein B224_1974 [Aeromonas media WS]|nr:hypothetical protein B224_1974 [Aeromonas media WS]
MRPQDPGAPDAVHLNPVIGGRNTISLDRRWLAEALAR